MNKICVVRKCERELIRELGVNRSMGESVCRVFFWNEREQEYGREGLRSLLFFFRVSFVASFLLDVLYGVRNKSELCVQVFFYEMILNGILAEGVCVARLCQSCVDK